MLGYNLRLAAEEPAPQPGALAAHRGRHRARHRRLDDLLGRAPRARQGPDPGEERRALLRAPGQLGPGARPTRATARTRPPTQITYRDAMAIMRSDIPVRQSGDVQDEPLRASPTRRPAAPTAEQVRVCISDFFPMFDVPFAYGSGWGREADAAAEPVVVHRRGRRTRSCSAAATASARRCASRTATSGSSACSRPGGPTRPLLRPHPATSSRPRRRSSSPSAARAA